MISRMIVTAMFCTLAAGAANGQSISTGEMFQGADVVHGITISRDRCRQFEVAETAVWVTIGGKGSCLRYYAYGLRTGGNPLAAGWLHGDVVASSHPTNADKHQKGLGVAAIIDQERRLSNLYHVPFVFLARPGAYGSAGYHPTTTSTKEEAELVTAQVAAITARYGIKAWVLGGHSGGGTMVGELIARRDDIRCAVISSGAPAHNAYLEAHDDASGISPSDLNAIADVAKIPRTGALRVIVMGDPRDENVFFPVQALYYEALKSHGVNAALLPLERGLPPEFHGLVSLAEAATGLCAEGRNLQDIEKALSAMPSQTPRISN
jgi:pimeloyl-ACP methyl ester carboxylesterase